MKIQEFEKALIEGGKPELNAFKSCRYCVVVDWKDDVEQILESVKRQLPEGYMQLFRVNEVDWEIKKGESIFRYKSPETTDTECILQSINSLLLPDYEMRFLMPEASDTSSLLLRPVGWWKEFATVYPARLEKLFITIDERIAQVGLGIPKKETWWAKFIGTHESDRRG